MLHTLGYGGLRHSLKLNTLPVSPIAKRSIRPSIPFSPSLIFGIHINKSVCEPTCFLRILGAFPVWYFFLSQKTKEGCCNEMDFWGCSRFNEEVRLFKFTIKEDRNCVLTWGFGCFVFFYRSDSEPGRQRRSYNPQEQDSTPPIPTGASYNASWLPA